MDRDHGQGGPSADVERHVQVTRRAAAVGCLWPLRVVSDMLPRMSDDPAAASFLDRVNTLSAPAVVGLGAAAGLLLAVLSALGVEPVSGEELKHVAPGPGPGPGPGDVAAAAQGPTATPDEDAVLGGSQPAAAGGRRAQPGGAKQNPAARSNAAADAEPEPDPPTLDPEDEAEDVALLEPDVGGSVDAEPEASEKAEDAAASAPPASPVGRTQSDRDAEAKMDADELLAAAADAYQDKRYKDAYRLATRSQRARPRDKAQMLRGRSACRLRDEKNAREIVRSFKLGNEHRKTLRSFCKDRGVRVGL